MTEQDAYEPLTDADLDAMEALVNAATPMPWYHDAECLCACVTTKPHGGGSVVCSAFRTVVHCETTDPLFTAKFIAHARDDVPRLLREVRRLSIIVRGHKSALRITRTMLGLPAESPNGGRDLLVALNEVRHLRAEQSAEVDAALRAKGANQS